MTTIIEQPSEDKPSGQQSTNEVNPVSPASQVEPIASLEHSAELPLVLKKMLCASASYYNGQLHRFVMTDTGELTLKRIISDKVEQKTTSMVLIVARSFYSEQARSYPIDNTKELKKLLALEADAANGGDEFIYHHWHTHKANDDKGNGQSQINVWQFSKQVPSAFLRLPETLLLALTCEKNQVLALTTDGVNNGCDQGELYLTRSNSSIYSSTKTGVINSVQRFAMSVGVSQSKSAKIVASKGLATQLAQGCKALTLPLIASFMQKPKVADRLQLLKNIAIPFLLVLAVYLATSSAYLLYKENSLQQQLTEQSSDVSVALTQQLKVDEQLIRYQAIQDFVATQRNTADLWLVMAQLLPQAQFTNVRITGERYVLRGKTKKATDLLELLSVNQTVKDAKFDFPVRKNRGQESFVISFELITVEGLPTAESLTTLEQALQDKQQSQSNKVKELNHAGT